MERERGLYIGYDKTPEIGLAAAIVYERDLKEFQMSFQIIDFAFAIGIKF